MGALLYARLCVKTGALEKAAPGAFEGGRRWLPYVLLALLYVPAALIGLTWGARSAARMLAG